MRSIIMNMYMLLKCQMLNQKIQEVKEAQEIQETYRTLETPKVV